MPKKGSKRKTPSKKDKEEVEEEQQTKKQKKDDKAKDEGKPDKADKAAEGPEEKHPAWATPGAVCHYDIPCNDITRAGKFYSTVFGWKCPPVKEGVPYGFWESSGGNKKLGCLAGGFLLTNAAPLPTTARAPFPYIFVTDIATALAKVHEHGGAVTEGASPVMPGEPQHGSMARFIDTEGNPVGVYSSEQTLTALVSLEHSVTLKMSPADLYESLLDSKKNSAFFGGRKCNIDRKRMGLFDAYDGAFSGRVIEFSEDKDTKTVVQSWREHSFPAGLYTLLTFIITDAGAGTSKLVMMQKAIPEAKFDMVDQGWKKLWPSVGLVGEIASKKLDMFGC